MGRKILVADDETDIQDMIRMRLEANGYEVISATDGIKVLDLVKENSPDLIVLDVMMPNLDGYHICRMIKFDQNFQSIPVVFLTSKAQPEDKKMAEEVKADAHISKPFEADVLLAKIKELIGE